MLDEITTVFENIVVSKEPVRFHNTYRGMPVSYSGTIVRMLKGGRVWFNVPKAQILCMRRDHITYLKSNLFYAPVKAKVVHIDWGKEIVELCDFTFIYTSIGDRKLVRVEPKDPIPVSLNPEGTRHYTNGAIIEISIRGLAIIIESKAYIMARYGKGEKVIIEYILPIDDVDVDTKTINHVGIVRNIIDQVHQDKYRIGFQTYPSSKIDKLLTRYLAQRQVELLREIKELCLEKPWN